MISRSTPLHNAPFLLRPSGKDYLWGGRRLKDDFGKALGLEPLAETWECSTHPDGPCIVAGGEFNGWTLSQVIREHPEFLGTHSPDKTGLPILIKLIDAKKDLSIQVHPDDSFARAHENGQPGKSEMWYVLDAAADTHLVFGLHHKVDQATLRQSITDGTIEKYLQKVPVKKNDVFFIEAGTIHALGAGALIVEIQQCSNLTYRLYDYDRVDRNGEKRELHIDKALEAADLGGNPMPVQPLRVLKYLPGCASELLCRCKYFEVHRMLINTENCRMMVPYRADSLSFRVLLCVSGCGDLIMETGRAIQFFKGDCVFFPANSMQVRLHGKAQFLDARG